MAIRNGYDTMNRYREGEVPGELGPPVFDYLSMGTAVYSVLLGIGLIIAGRRFKQLWMTVWGAGLVIVSVGFLIGLWLELP
jgi:hypothetical protein